MCYAARSVVLLVVPEWALHFLFCLVNQACEYEELGKNWLKRGTNAVTCHVTVNYDGFLKESPLKSNNSNRIDITNQSVWKLDN